MSLVEVTVAAAVTVLVLSGGISIFLFGSATWFRGQGKIDANQTSQRAVRNIAGELREAMTVVVDADGQGLNFRRPQKEADGSYTQPITWDGVARRIFLDNDGAVKVSGTGQPRTLAAGVITTDPMRSSAPFGYKIFTAGAGSITRSLTVMIVSQRASYRNEAVTSRSREVVYLRNVPMLTQ
jgi:Tfp pilus assembly protein PilW